uniref:heat shock 70 kDa protein II-like n=1 Tax=Styela clava TaxID=7725 RepID=UPI0019392F06|nr:heat shock 70 kDa protein II-like [Styela clava]
MTAIGIDLGTSYSCVAVFRNNRAEIIANDEGNRVTPSCVSFTDTERLIGDEAKSEESMNYANTLLQIKRLIGRTYDEEIVQKDLKLLGFEVLNKDNKPQIQVNYLNKVTTFYPEEVSAMVLTHLKEAAEAYIGSKVTDAVITVPAYFNDSQRKETKHAGEIAGFNVLQLLNEPTAAAIAYGIENEDEGARNILIFDLGGGTFDVTVMSIKNNVFEVKATGGDTHLGGEDLDNRMVDYFSKMFNEMHNVNMMNSKRALSRLRVACEAAKKKLSVATHAKIQIDGLYNGIDFKTTFSRATFENLNNYYFDKTIKTVEKTLTEAMLDKNKIDDVVLIGGSTRIPKIREMLQKFFSGKTLYKTINPDEAVALGAAAQAENLKSGKFILRDIVPLSLGVEVDGDFMSAVILKNTKIPTTRTINVTTARDDQTTLNISIYQGERAATIDNMFLGAFLLEGILPAPRGVASVELCFEIDSSGILDVSARDMKSGQKNKIIINDEKRLLEEDIARMTADAEKFKQADEELRNQHKSKNELEDFALRTKQSAQDLYSDQKMTKHEESRLVELCTETLTWLDLNKKANPAVLKQKKIELESIAHPIFSQLYLFDHTKTNLQKNSTENYAEFDNVKKFQMLILLLQLGPHRQILVLMIAQLSVTPTMRTELGHRIGETGEVLYALH